MASAFLVLQGALELAQADRLITANPARSKVVSKPSAGIGGKVVPWTDSTIGAVTDAHPGYLRLVPILMSGCGLRVGEALALALEDVDYDEGVIHVRRQIKKLGKDHIFSLPKSDLSRDVPMAGYVAAAIRLHVRTHPAWPCTLPSEKVTGKPETHQLLFQWSDGSYVRYRSYSELVFKPALAAAKVIPAPTLDARGRRRYQTTRREGPHQMRHYFASVMLADGASIRDVAEFLGHKDAGFTLQVYTHLEQGSHERARKIMDKRMFRPRAVGDS